MGKSPFFARKKLFLRRVVQIDIMHVGKHKFYQPQSIAMGWLLFQIKWEIFFGIVIKVDIEPIHLLAFRVNER